MNAYKCWIHGVVDEGDKKSSKLKEHSGFPDPSPNFQQNLLIALEPNQQTYRLKIEELEINEQERVKVAEVHFQQIEKEKADFKKKQLVKEQKLTEEKQAINDKLNHLIARVLNISEKPVGTFNPELKKQKGVKELLERYSVESLEELVAFIDKKVKKGEGTNEMVEGLQELLDHYSVANLKELSQVLKNNEQDYLERIEELLRPRKGGKWDNEEMEELIAEKDQLSRDKGELEMEVLDYNNKLKLKQQEVNRKETEIERLKKEQDQKEISHQNQLKEKNVLITTLNKEINQYKTKIEQLEKKST